MADECGRRELASQQKALVDALTRRADPPDGFRGDQIETAAAALAKKRLRTAHKAWPALAESLGDAFEPLFGTYAATNILADGDALVDARRFLRFVLSQADLSDAQRLPLLPLRAQSGFPVRWHIGRGGIGAAIRWWGGRVSSFVAARHARSTLPGR